MATISNIKLIVGKVSNSNKEFVQVSFDLGFTSTEVNYADGYYLRGFLYSINDNVDSINLNYWGGIHLEPQGNDTPDMLMGSIFSEHYIPPGTTDHIVRQTEEDLRTAAPGEENFRVIISIVPKVPGVVPTAALSGEVKIDPG